MKAFLLEAATKLRDFVNCFLLEAANTRDFNERTSTGQTVDLRPKSNRDVLKLISSTVSFLAGMKVGFDILA